MPQQDDNMTRRLESYVSKVLYVRVWESLVVSSSAYATLNKRLFNSWMTFESNSECSCSQNLKMAHTGVMGGFGSSRWDGIRKKRCVEGCQTTRARSCP